MPIVVLLVVGLASLAVGLLLSSTTWLVVSLVASVLAAASLYRDRDQIARRPSRAAHSGQPVDAPEARNGFVSADAAGTPTSAAAPTSADPPREADVWVVDGRPRYHRESCEIIRDQPVEAIPHSQANEDGFIPCSLCEPDRAHSARSV